MRKIFLICSLLIGAVAFSQSVVDRANPANTVADYRWMAKYNAFIPRYTDTLSANTKIGIDTAGAIIYTYDYKGFWYREHNPKKWARVISASNLGSEFYFDSTCNCMKVDSSFFATFLTTIINNTLLDSSVLSISVVNDSTIRICYANGSCVNIGIVTNITNISTVYLLNKDSIVVCATDTVTTVTTCDTIAFNRQQYLYHFQNALTESASHVVELGGNLVHSTGVDADYYYLNLYGRTVQNYPYRFRQYQYFTNSTAITSFQNDYAAVRLGFNYTGNPIRTAGGGGFIPGYMFPYKGYWLGLNGVGAINDPQGNLIVDNNTWKSPFIFFHGNDTASTAGITLGAIPPNYSGTTTATPMYQNMGLTIHTNKKLTGWGYGSSSSFLSSDTTNKPIAADASGNLVRMNYWPGSGGGTVTATFPINASANNVSLFPKIPYQNFAVSQESPYEAALQWDTLTTTTTPHFYDGTALAYVNDTLVRPYGWYTDGVNTWSSDSIYLSVPPYRTWTLSTTRFPIRTHWVAYTFNRARGYWVFCGGDPFNNSTDQKSVWTTTDFRTFTKRTSNYGGSVRVLGGAWADDNGSIYWGLGQTGITDTASHLDDIWRSDDDGVTWSQVATNLNKNGFTFGGNDGNQIYYRNGYVIAVGVGGKYGATKTYSNRCFVSNISDPTKWWEIDTIPIPAAVQYPMTNLFNGWIWYEGGNNGASNTDSTYYLDQAFKWHVYRGYGEGTATLGISHAQGSVVFKNALYISTGNDNNTSYVLKRNGKLFVDGYKQIYGHTYVGDNTYPFDFRVNTSIGSETANTFIEMNAPVNNRSFKAVLSTDAFAALVIKPQTVTNNITAVDYNDTWYVGATHAASSYGATNAFVWYQGATNYLPLVLKSNGHLIVNNNATTAPTNISGLQIRGLTAGSSTDSVMTVDANGNVFYRNSSAFGISGITANNGLTASTSTNVQLGGTFTTDVTENTNGHTFFINGTTNNTVNINTTSGAGLVISSTSGVPIQTSSVSNIAAQFISYDVGTTNISSIATLTRNTANTAANGIGGSLDFSVQTSTSATRLSNQLISKWTDATDTTRTSQFIITGVNSSVTGDIAYFNGNGMVGIGSASPDATRLNVVDDAIGGASLVKISSSSTAASGGIQRLLDVQLSGANSTSGQTTKAGFFVNSHTGSSSTNFGIDASSNGGTTNYGVSASSYGGSVNYALAGQVTQSSSINYGLYALASGASSTNYGGYFSATNGTENDAIYTDYGSLLLNQSAGNVLIGGNINATSASKVLHIFNGTAPSASVTHGILLYSENVSSSAELKVRDEAGNVTVLSPHNFTGIPEGKSENLSWAYYSEKDGKYINVDMLKLARLVEKLTGEKLVFIGETKDKPNPQNK